MSALHHQQKARHQNQQILMVHADDKQEMIATQSSPITAQVVTPIDYSMPAMPTGIEGALIAFSDRIGSFMDTLLKIDHVNRKVENITKSEMTTSPLFFSDISMSELERFFAKVAVL